MPKFDENIRQAILRAAEIAGSQKLLAEATGATRANINKYVHGKMKTIREDTWQRLYPYIAPYLSGDSRQPERIDAPPVPGDAVRLRSGGPLMTVDRVGDGAVVCVWFRGKEVDRAEFSAAALLRDASGLDKCIEDQTYHRRLAAVEEQLNKHLEGR